MGKVIHSWLYEYQGQLWRVNSAKSGLRTDILRTLLAQLNAMILQHRKVFVYRFDLSVNDFTSNNELVTGLVRRLKRRVKVHYGIDTTYCWVREQEKAKKQHYHFCLMLNGSKIENPKLLQKWLVAIWERYGRCHWAGYHQINRHDQSAIQKASFHISYLAKHRGKGNRCRPEQTKDYGHSRI